MKQGEEHPTSDMLEDFVDGFLLVDQYRLIREHLTHCAVCTRTVDRLWSFNSVLTQVSLDPKPAPFSVAADSGRIEQAAEFADAQGYRVWAERLRKWNERFKGKVDTVMQIVVGVQGEAARILLESFESLPLPEPRLKLAYRVVGGGVGRSTPAKPDFTFVRSEEGDDVEAFLETDPNRYVITLNNIDSPEALPLYYLESTMAEKSQLFPEITRMGQHTFRLVFHDVTGRYAVRRIPPEADWDKIKLVKW